MLGSIVGALGKVGGALGTIISVASNIPQIISLVERIASLFKGSVSGPDKKAVVMALVKDSIMAAEGITDKDIVDEQAFVEGLGEVVDGTVKMLNASVWYKK